MKRNLKHKSLLLLVLLLTAALLLAACGEVSSQTGTEADSAAQSAANNSAQSGADSNPVSVGGDDEQSGWSDLSGQGSGSASGSATVSGSGSTSEVFAEAFSERDLSGAYDDAVYTITLTGDGASSDSDQVSVSGSTVTVSGAGTYLVSGSLSDGSIVVEATKEDKVQLVLSGVSISSSDFAAIYVKQADKVFITLAEGTENSLSNGGSYVQQDENEVDSVIFAKDDITLNGSGSLTITAASGSGVVGKDEVTVTGGSYLITADQNGIRAKDSLAIADGSFTITAGSDGLHAENGDDESLGNLYIAGGSFNIQVKDDGIHANTLLQIDGGSIQISAAEGLEATYIQINGGEISISASDDGVNAAQKSSVYTPTFEMNDGSLTIVMGGGDTDAVDSNGNIVVNGGTINITAQSSFDCDGSAQYNGGTIIVNGQQIDSIPNQFMGGGMGGFGGMGGMGGNGAGNGTGNGGFGGGGFGGGGGRR